MPFLEITDRIYLTYTAFNGYNPKQQRTKFKIINPEGIYVGDTTIPASIRTDVSLRMIVAHGFLMIIVRNGETEEIEPTVFSISSQIDGFEYSNTIPPGH